VALEAIGDVFSLCTQHYFKLPFAVIAVEIKIDITLIVSNNNRRWGKDFHLFSILKRFDIAEKFGF